MPYWLPESRHLAMWNRVRWGCFPEVSGSSHRLNAVPSFPTPLEFANFSSFLLIGQSRAIWLNSLCFPQLLPLNKRAFHLIILQGGTIEQ